MPRLKVYYNSACPVCDAGIKGQRSRMSDCGGAEVEWVDIHCNADAVTEIGAEREFVRERLHVVDEKGQVNVGADAFAVLWRHTPRQAWLSRLVRLPVVAPLVRGLYNVFAACLYSWNRARKRWEPGR